MCSRISSTGSRIQPPSLPGQHTLTLDNSHLLTSRIITTNLPRTCRVSVRLLISLHHSPGRQNQSLISLPYSPDLNPRSEKNQASQTGALDPPPFPPQ